MHNATIVNELVVRWLLKETTNGMYAIDLVHQFINQMEELLQVNRQNILFLSNNYSHFVWWYEE